MKNLSLSTIRRTLLVLAASTIMLLTVRQATAGVSSTVSKSGFLSGVTAYGRVRSFSGEAHYSGVCDISSYTSPYTTINVIGWTWWQCDRQVNGSYYDSVPGEASAITASTNSDSIYWPYAFVAPVNGLMAHGVHDFNHDGSSPSPWRPYNYNIYP